MPTRRSFLIDTNIVIHLEDGKPVDPEFAEMMRRCAKHGIRVLTHEGSESDIRRDAQDERRTTTLSKLGKFEKLRRLALPNESILEAKYGRIANDNDRIDVELLYALERNASDFLITQDLGIHKRARNAGLADRVLRVQDAIDWLKSTFDPAEVVLPDLAPRFCYELDVNDPIFHTLREEYPEFDVCFAKSAAAHRECWTLEFDGVTAGILIRKDNEPRSETDAQLPGQKILKISTLKIREKYRGEKFGELLLKQVLWYAQKNHYDLVYVTAYADKQAVLLDLLTQFGFVYTHDKATGEAVLEKRLGSGPILESDADPLTLAIRHYPRFVADSRADIYCIPIRPHWYRVLFPENALPTQPELPFSRPSNRTPGNTIRKVYLCHAQTNFMRPGSVLLFYVSGRDAISRAVRTVGVVERMQITEDSATLLRYTGRRSVYTQDEQIDMASVKAVKVIDFLVMGHFANPVPLEFLQATTVLRKWPQSIVKLDSSTYAKLDLHALLGY